MTRILLAAASAAPADAPSEPLARLARALRDGGHEVVHAGAGQRPAGIAAAAVQEDVEVVVLLAPDVEEAEEVERAAAALAAAVDDALAAQDAADVDVVLAAPEDEPATVVARVERAAAPG